MANKRVLSVDYGTKRIGIATGSLETKVAFPRDTILNKGIVFVSDEIFDVCKKWEIDLIVVGMPLNMREDQSETPMIRAVDKFVEVLKKKIEESKDENISKMKVEFFDERLSSFEADSLMKSAQKKDKDRAEYRDAYAAQIILQRFFDSKEK